MNRTKQQELPSAYSRILWIGRVVICGGVISFDPTPQVPRAPQHPLCRSPGPAHLPSPILPLRTEQMPRAFKYRIQEILAADYRSIREMAHPASQHPSERNLPHPRRLGLDQSLLLRIKLLLASPLRFTTFFIAPLRSTRSPTPVDRILRYSNATSFAQEAASAATPKCALTVRSKPARS